MNATEKYSQNEITLKRAKRTGQPYVFWDYEEVTPNIYKLPILTELPPGWDLYGPSFSWPCVDDVVEFIEEHEEVTIAFASVRVSFGPSLVTQGFVRAPAIPLRA